MASTGLTSSTVNGVLEVTTANTLTGASDGATDEQLLIYGWGAIRAGSTGDVTFTRCNILINELNYVNASGINLVAFSYNGDDTDRKVTTRFIRMIDSSLIYDIGIENRRNVFFSELTRSKIFDQDSQRKLFVYTQPGAILDTVIFNGISVWEVVGAPAVASNVKAVNCNYGLLNWEAGRLDFVFLDVQNAAIADVWIGLANSGNNSVYVWDKINLDNTSLRLQHANNEFFEGNTATYRFTDRSTGANVSDVLVILDSDISGSRAELGRYTTNSNGRLVGTYDTQNDTTGASIERPTLFVINNYSDVAGSTYTSPVSGLSFDITAVTNYLEVRSFAHLRPEGYTASDTFNITSPVGLLNADYSVNTYFNFVLAPDTNLTVTNESTIAAYTELEDDNKLYDRAKYEWRQNDGYPYPTKTINGVSFENVNLVHDSTAGSAYTFSGGTITADLGLRYAGDLALGTGTYSTGGNGEEVVGVITDSSGITSTALSTFPNWADGTRYNLVYRQQFAVTASQIDTATDIITLTNDLNGNPPLFSIATSGRHTLANINKDANAVLPTSSNQIIDTGTYRISAFAGFQCQLELTEGSGAINFTSTGTNGDNGYVFILTTETLILEGTISGGAGLEGIIDLPDGSNVRVRAIHQVVNAGIRTSTNLYDQVFTWSDANGISSSVVIDANGSTNLWTDVNRLASLSSVLLEDPIIDNAGNVITSVVPVGDGSGIGGLSFSLEGLGFIQVNAGAVTKDAVSVNGALWSGDLILWGVSQINELDTLWLASETTLVLNGLTDCIIDNVEIDNTSSDLFQIYGIHVREKNGRPLVASTTTGPVVPNLAIRGNAALVGENGAVFAQLTGDQATELTNSVKITDVAFHSLGSVTFGR